jgi:hypothetical protein
MALGVVLTSGVPASASARAVPSFVRPGTAAASIAGTHVIHVLHSGRTARVLAGPDIQEQSCTSSRKNWVHIDSSEGNLCFGSAGTAEFYPYPQVAQFCAGNNHGSYEYYDANSGNTYIRITLRDS